MKILILGGTRFLGRHLALQALAAGHALSLLHRGRSAGGLFPQADHRIADRNDAAALSAALAGGEWDAVIDTSAYFPRQVRQAAAALAGRVGHYQLVSTISVYARPDAAQTAEDAPLQTLADPSLEEVGGAHYGGLKALCEAEARSAFGARCLVSRPGLLVGPHDPTGRFTWWVQRFQRAAAGGDDAEVLAPGDPAGPVQLIDARDAAAWMLRQAETGATGTFNLTGPATPLTMDRLLATAQHTLAPLARLCWVDEPFLGAQGVAPWSDLPLWLPAADAGMLRVDIGRALATGLRCRPLAMTWADTAAWVDGEPGRSGVAAAPDGPQRPPVGLAPAREAALRQAWAMARAAGGA